MRKNKPIVAILAIIFLLVGCAENPQTTEQEHKLILTSAYSGEEVDVIHPRLREYLTLTEENEICSFLSKYSETDFSKPRYTLTWETTYAENYTVQIGQDQSLIESYNFVTSETSLSVGWLCPGEQYYWKVTASSGEDSAIGSFKVKDEPIRTLDIDGVGNVRDIGGWTTESGKRVKYGLIYRGGRLNGKISDAGKETMTDVLNIKTELDLRGTSDDGGQIACEFSQNGNYVKIPLAQYARILPEYTGYSKNSKQAIADIFTALADENNYPMYIHCNWGADRTGTICFLINGLLGVSYQDLTKDFETTSFSTSGKRWRDNIKNGSFEGSGIMQNDSNNFVAWDYTYRLLLKNYAQEGDSLSEAIETYLLSCGVTATQIQSVKGMLLE